MDYNELRHLADSWGLVYLFFVFVCVIFFTFRPRSKEQWESAAQIPLKEDNENV